MSNTLTTTVDLGANSFSYDVVRIKDIRPLSSITGKNGRQVITRMEVKDGLVVRPSERFWTSLFARFGFNGSVFKYFQVREVFDRISQVSPNDEVRLCVENANAVVKDNGKPLVTLNGDGAALDGRPITGTLLAVSATTAPVAKYAETLQLLRERGGEELNYNGGIVSSRHTPRALRGDEFQIGGDAFEHRFVIDTPIDGYGRPNVYLSLLRLICTNGAIAYTKAFRSELTLGRGDNGNVSFALQRALDSFNNEEGFLALRQRFEAAQHSWASVGEAMKLYRTLVKLHSSPEYLKKAAPDLASISEANNAVRDGRGGDLLPKFHALTGDISQIYGLANLDALSAKRQRTLPVGCTVYDLVNFASEVATHHAAGQGSRLVNGWIGETVGAEYDLEGTGEKFKDFRDFFVGDDAAAETIAALQKRS